MNPLSRLFFEKNYEPGKNAWQNTARGIASLIFQRNRFDGNHPANSQSAINAVEVLHTVNALGCIIINIIISKESIIK